MDNEIYSNYIKNISQIFHKDEEYLKIRFDILNKIYKNEIIINESSNKSFCDEENMKNEEIKEIDNNLSIENKTDANKGLDDI